MGVPVKTNRHSVSFSVPVKVVTGDTVATDSVELFKLLNKIGHDNGVGRVDVSSYPYAPSQSFTAYRGTPHARACFSNTAQ
jgi:hypothetical protein